MSESSVGDASTQDPTRIPGSHPCLHIIGCVRFAKDPRMSPFGVPAGFVECNPRGIMDGAARLSILGLDNLFKPEFCEDCDEPANLPFRNAC